MKQDLLELFNQYSRALVSLTIYIQKQGLLATVIITHCYNPSPTGKVQYHFLEQAPPRPRRGWEDVGGHPSLSWPLIGWFWPLLAATLTPLLFSTDKVGSEMLQVKGRRSGDSSEREASGNPV